MTKKQELPDGYTHLQRTFLNDEGHQSIAMLYAYIKVEKPDQEYVDADLILSDCNRSISYSVYEWEDVAKLDRLIEGLTNFRAAFSKEMRRVDRLKK